MTAQPLAAKYTLEGVAEANRLMQQHSAKAVTELEKVDKQTKETGQNLRKAWGDAIPAVGQLDQAATQFLATIKSMPPAVGIVALGLAGAALEAKALAVALRELDAASGRLGVSRQFEIRMGGIQQAESQLKGLRALVDNTAGRGELTALSNRAATRGIDADTFSEILKTANELSAVTGQELIPTIEQLNQAVGTGTVRAFSSAGADVRALIAEFGEGRLTIEETRLVMKRLQEQLDGSGDSLSDAFGEVKESGSDAWAAMVEANAQNPALVAGTQALAGWVTILSDAYIDAVSSVRDFYTWQQKVLGLAPEVQAVANNWRGGVPYNSQFGSAQYQQMLTNPAMNGGSLALSNGPYSPEGYLGRRPFIESRRTSGGPGARTPRSTYRPDLGMTQEEFNLMVAYEGDAWMYAQSGGYYDSYLPALAEMQNQQITQSRPSTSATGGYGSRRSPNGQNNIFQGMSFFMPSMNQTSAQGTIPWRNSGGRHTGDIAAEMGMQALGSIIGGDYQGAATTAIGTGAGLVFSNTLAAASVLGGPVGTMVGMALGSLLGSAAGGLFGPEERTSQTDPIYTYVVNFDELKQTILEFASLIAGGGISSLDRELAVASTGVRLR